MSQSFVENLRLSEFALVLAEIKALKHDGCRILEIGAGTGLQAKEFSDAGFKIDAIDIKESAYRGSRIWPVEDYDGIHIPFSDQMFDVVLSSSVLEHVPHLDQMQREIERVLKDDGIAVHVVPGASWVLLSALTHYPYIFKLAFNQLRGMLSGRSVNSSPGKGVPPKRLRERFTLIEMVVRVLMPPRHGERGIWLSELHYFSKRAWVKCFEESGWTIEKYLTNKLFYSGNLIFGSRLNLESRKRLGRILFGVCHVFVLTKSRSKI